MVEEEEEEEEEEEDEDDEEEALFILDDFELDGFSLPCAGESLAMLQMM